MPSLKKLPLSSLILLLLTHGVLGWQLSAFMGLGWATSNLFAAHSPIILVWLVVVVSDILLAMALSTPLAQRRNEFLNLFKTDTRAFVVAVILSFLSVLVITWLHVFVHILVVVAAATLVKLETQIAKWSYRHIFWLLTIASIIGLGLGALAQVVFGEWLGVRL